MSVFALSAFLSLTFESIDEFETSAASSLSDNFSHLTFSGTSFAFSEADETSLKSL